uniref:Uncharacterized protein n=1 Tax=Vitrella brassicaformis TaxID=1169539 RepID=A0A7S1JRZ7_9ALVE|mmetsp:Transcript_2069/g.4661  ORF Transcript_2069/g.4661 Transcript_2069/m.4661 type:complete len:100 (+) Transcript_2069:286-585(+)
MRRGGWSGWPSTWPSGRGTASPTGRASELAREAAMLVWQNQAWLRWPQENKEPVAETDAKVREMNKRTKRQMEQQSQEAAGGGGAPEQPLVSPTWAVHQ